MAQYLIPHTCGHIGHYNLTGSGRDRDQREAWLKSKACPDCRRETETQEMRREAIEAGLPVLVGSPKQTAWALRIRHRILGEVADYLAEWERLLAKNGNGTASEADVAAHRAALRNAQKQAEETAGAGWWIDRQDATGRTLLRELLKK